MNGLDPLADLHPLRTPELIGWWPPAPGWWILLVAVVACLLALAWFIHRHYRRNRYRRRALQQLQRLHAQYLESGDADAFLVQINALLKRIALLAYPEAGLASRHGAHWRAFLNTSLPPTEQLQDSFDEAVYQQASPAVDVAQVHRAAQLWIRQHRGAR